MSDSTSTLPALYVPLDVGFYEDDKFLQVSDAAGYLYVKALCFIKRMMQEGRISTRQLGRLYDSGEPVRSLERITNELVGASLFEPDGPDHYVLPAWPKWHKSNAEISEARREAGRIGGRRSGEARRSNLAKHDEANDEANEANEAIDKEKTETETETEKETETETETVVAPKRRRATTIPSGFSVSQGLRQLAAENWPSVDLDQETQHFIDYHQAKGSTMKDWDAAWRTWMHNAVKFDNGRHRSPPLGAPRVEDCRRCNGRGSLMGQGGIRPCPDCCDLQGRARTRPTR